MSIISIHVHIHVPINITFKWNNQSVAFSLLYLSSLPEKHAKVMKLRVGWGEQGNFSFPPPSPTLSSPALFSPSFCSPKVHSFTCSLSCWISLPGKGKETAATQATIMCRVWSMRAVAKRSRLTFLLGNVPVLWLEVHCYFLTCVVDIVQLSNLVHLSQTDCSRLKCAVILCALVYPLNYENS